MKSPVNTFFPPPPCRIMREDFLSIKKKLEEAKKEKIAILKCCVPGLDNINSRLILEQLAYVFNEQSFLKGDLLAREDEKSMTMYILISGTLEVSRRVSVEVPENSTTITSQLSSLITPSSMSSQTLTKTS